MREKNGTSNTSTCKKCGSMNTSEKNGFVICNSCGTKTAKK